MLGRLALSLLSCATAVLSASLVGSTGAAGAAEDPKKGSWLVMSRTWSKVLDTAGGTSSETPVTRVVNLLKEMGKTLQKEADEDEALFDKLACWCNNNRYEKDAAIKAATAKIADLKSTIDGSTAKSADLKETIKSTEAEVAGDKAALAEATAQREKQAKEFHGTEKETIANIESLKQAIRTLGKHTGAALPQFEVSQVSLLSISSQTREIPWSDNHESSGEREFGDFMRHSGLHSDAGAMQTDDAPADSSQGFLQKQDEPQLAPLATVVGWSAADTALVRSALKSATAFVQRKHGGEVFYAPQSGEILGVLKQLKDEMDASLSDSQSEEKEAAATFHELRSAKTAEIENGESTAERKEDELAETNNELAEAKEDLDQTNSVLSADMKFMVNLKSTCTDADANFEKRKAARINEIKAVSETIEILTSDEARDNMDKTYNFLQTTSSVHIDSRRQRAAAVLRKAGNPELSMLATAVQLDAFDKVKKAIDDMIGQLKTQQGDEVKKQDWCNAELRSNEMDTMKANSLKDEQDMKVSDLTSNVEKLTDEVTQAKKDIDQLHVELQRASENRKQANMDFQTTIAEQRATQEVLKSAIERLAKYYDFAQTHSKASMGHTQTPPVAQATHEPNAGASGVMSMIEKLIIEAKNLEKDSQKGEKEDQAQYEALVADTNASVKALQKLVVTKMAEKAEASKENIETAADLKSTQADIEGLGKYDADLHGECDYILKNFDVRQSARQQEIEALQQAKSILSGASASR